MPLRSARSSSFPFAILAGNVASAIMMLIAQA
jgi:hypothetical protein